MTKNDEEKNIEDILASKLEEGTVFLDSQGSIYLKMMNGALLLKNNGDRFGSLDFQYFEDYAYSEDIDTKVSLGFIDSVDIVGCSEDKIFCAKRMLEL